MTRKKKIVITIVSALVAVLVSVAVGFTIYRNVQLERLRVFIVDSLLEQEKSPYDLSKRKYKYDVIEIRAVYRYDRNSYFEHKKRNDSTFEAVFEDTMKNDEFDQYFSSYVKRPFYIIVLHSAGTELNTGSGSQEGYYDCGIEYSDGKWWLSYFTGPYITASECTPTEFVRRIL